MHGTSRVNMCIFQTEKGKIIWRKFHIVNPLSANPTKFSLSLSVFDHFVKLALKWLLTFIENQLKAPIINLILKILVAISKLY